MTIQKTVVRIRGKIYEVILEDGVVTYMDPEAPEESWSLNQLQDQKVMSIETAKKLVAQAIERAPHPMMTFSD